MDTPIIKVAIRAEQDTVTTRQRARQVAEGLGFQQQDQTRIATAVSEIARNAFRYAGGGQAEFLLAGSTAPQLLIIKISDNGPGIADLPRILEGRYTSPTGMGMGIIGTRRLMDQFEIQTAPGRGTTVTLKKILPSGRLLIRQEAILDLVNRLAAHSPRNPLAELELQNQELLRTLDELRRRQEDLLRLNAELEDTNRGVVALYAELDERADHLRRADAIKTKFLSNMSHEFRSPLNSILALSGLLLQLSDGPLNQEQVLQVGFIKKAAQDLYELVNDLLDLAKVEAGRVDVKPVYFEVANLFGALRGMLRPLLLNRSVDLIFDDAAELPEIYSDEGKVSQILRNLISNALKFTEHGQVRISARLDGEQLEISVMDTGVGIAKEDQDRIFEDFAQVDNPIQRKVKGTGLGLPLSRKLAHLLGGEIHLESELGAGSTFRVTIPMRIAVQEASVALASEEGAHGDPVLVVENRPDTALLYSRWLAPTEFRVVHVTSTRDAQRQITIEKPVAILLDLLLDGEDSWSLLASLKDSEETRAIPIIVCSSVEDQRKALHLGADGYLVKPFSEEALLHTLRNATSGKKSTKVLIIDDDDGDRYLVKHKLRGGKIEILEASSGKEGLAKARISHPEIIILDLSMPEMTGFEVLSALKGDPETESIAVVVHTSAHLSVADRDRLRASAAIVKKEGLNPHGQDLLIAAMSATGRLANFF